MSKKRTSVEIKAELDASLQILESVRSRIQIIQDLIAAHETELVELTKQETGLNGDWRGGGGSIGQLKGQYAATKQIEENQKLPIVTVKPRWSSEAHQWRFVKKTPKRIFLIPSESHRTEQWDLAGTHPYYGTITPADLARILDGSINQGPTQ